MRACARFNDPVAMVLNGADLFVANAVGGSLSELNAAQGRLSR